VLKAPDITIIAGMADYPAAIVHKSYDNGDPTQPRRHRPLPAGNRGSRRQGVLVKNPNHTWWGTAVYGGPWLDKIEYIDLGTDPAAEVAAAGSGEIDATYQSVGEFIDLLDGLGWTKSEAVTSATLAVRFNQLAEEYKDVNVRRGLIKASTTRWCWNWAIPTSGHGRGKPPRLPDPPGILCAAPAGGGPRRGQGRDRSRRVGRLRVRADLAGRRLAGRHL
jgi:ABC-type transport system substrate-binding protein